MNFKKIIFILFCFFFFSLSVKAYGGQLLHIDFCNKVTPGNSTTCDIIFYTGTNSSCTGLNCSSPGSDNEPLYGNYVSSLSVGNNFTLSNCVITSGNASCMVKNNIITLIPNNIPFSGEIYGKITVNVSNNTVPKYYMFGTNNQKERFYIDVSTKQTTTKQSTTTTTTTTTKKNTTTIKKKTTTVENKTTTKNTSTTTKKTTSISTTKNTAPTNKNNKTTTSTKKEKEYGLIDLKASYGNLNFDKERYNYDLTVPYEVMNLYFEETLKDNSYVSEITGNTNLQVGNNLIVVNIKKNNIIDDTYNINVTKLEKNKCFINDIYIKDYDINFNQNNKEYDLTIKEEKLDIKVSLNEYCEDYKILNNNDLKNGSKIKIIINDENSEDLSYIINITKKEKNYIVILSLTLIALVLIIPIVYIIMKKSKNKKIQNDI